MGALGHFLEREGIPTVGISLVREHTEKIRPPRALWVTFELGRPFGIPDDAAFQRRVMQGALGLIERTDGPLIADYPEHVAEEADFTGWACPINLAPAGARRVRGRAERARGFRLCRRRSGALAGSRGAARVAAGTA